MAKEKREWPDYLNTLSDDVTLAADQYKGFADVWASLNDEQRKAVKRLVTRAERLIGDLCSSWADYGLPEPPWRQ